MQLLPYLFLLGGATTWARGEDQVIGSDDIIGAVLDEVMQCPGVTIDPNSCLVSTALQGLDEMMGLGGGGGDEGDGGHGSGHRRLIHSIPGLCTPPEIDQDEVRLMLEFAAATCSQAGITVDAQEIDATLDSVIHAFSSSCFDSICHRMMAEALAVGFDSAAACAEIPPFGDDCLTRATIKSMADEGSDFRFPQMSLEVCHFQDLEFEALVNKIAESGNACTVEVGGEPSTHTQEDIESLATKLTHLFDATACWESYCPADDEYYSEGDEDDEGSSSDDFFARLMADHLFECAGVGNTSTSTTSTPSCLDTTLENILFYGDFTTAASSSSFSATSPAETNGAIQGSVTPVRRHLQQLRHFSSTSRSGTNAIDNTAYGEFGNEEYPPHHDDAEGDDIGCIVPEVDTEALEFMVGMAKEICEQGGQAVENDDIMAVTNKYTALFSASHCWEQVLCDDELHWKLIGDYFKECADIDLPFASTSTSMPDDGMISCMLDFTMSTPHAAFGLSLQQQDPFDQCYPPGHRDVAGTCPAIATLALQHCLSDNNDGFFGQDDDFFGSSMSYEYGDMDWGWGEDLFFEDQFFFSMSMSMSYGYGDNDDIDKPPPPPPVDPDRDARLMEDFCMLIEKLSSDKGKQCLLPLCDGITGADDDVLETTAPSTEPSAEPSPQPSLQPSVSHSAVPSVAPSQASSASPSSPPSTEYSNGVVEIRYEAAIKVDGLDVSSIPTSPGEALTKLLTVLTSSISQFLPEDTTVKITSIGGVPVADIGTVAISRPTTTTSTSDGRLRRYRLLDADTGVEIEFEVVSTVECDDVECTDADEISNQAYETMNQGMIQAVDSGDLTSTLQTEAAAADVVALASITIDSFEAEEPTITITEGSDDDSGASSLQILTAAAISVFAAMVGFAQFVDC